MAVTEKTNRAPRETDLDRLNKLIDWYERFKPEAGKEIQVAVTPLALAKMFGIKDKDGDWEPQELVVHRGRKIVCTGP